MEFLGACKNGELFRVDRFLRDPCVDPSADDNRALIIAIKHNQDGVIFRLWGRVAPSGFPALVAEQPFGDDLQA
jgi:hypothetical protein